MTSQELKEWLEKKIKEYDDDRLIARTKLKEPTKIETPFGFFYFHANAPKAKDCPP